MPDRKELKRRRIALIDALTKRGVSQSDIAKCTGISALELDTFYAGQSDAKVPRYEEAFSHALGISLATLTSNSETLPTTPNHLPVVGVLKAGAWLESTEHEVIDTAPVLADLRYPAGKQFVMQVQGSSMDKFISHGDYVHCVDWDTAGPTLQDDMIVVVQRHRQGLTESTLKQVKIGTRGDICLLSRSDNERHQLSILYRPDQTTDDGCDLTIQAMVIGHFRSFH